MTLECFEQIFAGNDSTVVTRTSSTQVTHKDVFYIAYIFREGFVRIGSQYDTSESAVCSSVGLHVQQLVVQFQRFVGIGQRILIIAM